jgi:predicted ribosome quality control (RQC) complex YloA/Tae2 family protein
MKQLTINDVTYYIGTNAKDNFAVLDAGKPDDIWIHASNMPSSHVIIVNESKTNKKAIRLGAALCKQNTNKIAKLKNVEFVYTYVKHVTKTAVDGSVLITNEKTIIV